MVLGGGGASRKEPRLDVCGSLGGPLWHWGSFMNGGEAGGCVVHSGSFMDGAEAGGCVAYWQFWSIIASCLTVSCV